MSQAAEDEAAYRRRHHGYPSGLEVERHLGCEVVVRGDDTSIVVCADAKQPTITHRGRCPHDPTPGAEGECLRNEYSLHGGVQQSLGKDLRERAAKTQYAMAPRGRRSRKRREAKKERLRAAKAAIANEVTDMIQEQDAQSEAGYTELRIFMDALNDRLQLLLDDDASNGINRADSQVAPLIAYLGNMERLYGYFHATDASELKTRDGGVLGVVVDAFGTASSVFADASVTLGASRDDVALSSDDVAELMNIQERALVAGTIDAKLVAANLNEVIASSLATEDLTLADLDDDATTETRASANPLGWLLGISSEQVAEVTALSCPAADVFVNSLTIIKLAGADNATLSADKVAGLQQLKNGLCAIEKSARVSLNLMRAALGDGWLMARVIGVNRHDWMTLLAAEFAILTLAGIVALLKLAQSVNSRFNLVGWVRDYLQTHIDSYRLKAQLAPIFDIVTSSSKGVTSFTVNVSSGGVTAGAASFMLSSLGFMSALSNYVTADLTWWKLFVWTLGAMAARVILYILMWMLIG